INRKKLHKLNDIFFITLCAVICGANDWVSIEMFGKSKEAWFTKVLGLKHGILSHDTFCNVFAVIDKVDDKSNEITAIPKLLMQLDITGAVVTIDAMGCQTKVAQQIIGQEADYMLSLKGNQGNLHKDVKLFFETENTCPALGYESYDGGHGRIETRTVRATSAIGWLLELHPQWPGLKSIVAVTAKREGKDKTTEETRYFISSMDASDPKRLGQVVRAHWGIENNLHWVLDYAFDEDSQRTRVGNSAANMAVIRHIALNLLKSEKTARVGVKNKRLKAGWDEDYLLKVVLGGGAGRSEKISQ
ncbi:MAG: ISAs1 family transposase, partial [Methylobacter sp.]|nr:ISAs1 family transposase [Methylobacter sp.]